MKASKWKGKMRAGGRRSIVRCLEANRVRPESLGRKARVVFAPLRGKAHMLISPTAPDRTAGSDFNRSPPEKEAFVRRGVSRDTGCLHCGLSQARKVEVGLKEHYIFA